MRPAGILADLRRRSYERILADNAAPVDSVFKGLGAGVLTHKPTSAT
jgi:hypothetical protein